MTTSSSVPTWKKVAAAILDFLTVFVAAGTAIALVTGNTTSGGFELEGASALLLFGVVIAYFVLMPRVGGTIWQRILKTR